MSRQDDAVSWVRGLAVVSAAGEIDVSNADQFGQALLSCINGEHATIVVDMSETTFCDMSGLHQLVRAQQCASAAGGQVRLVIRAAMVLRIFAITGFDDLFPIFASLDDAIVGQPAPVIQPRAAPATAAASGYCLAPARQREEPHVAQLKFGQTGR